MQTRLVIRGSQALREVEELYLNAFPRNERISLSILLRKSRKASSEFLAYYDEGSFVGFTYVHSSRGIAYVLYLAVNTKIQSKGYGSRILTSLDAQYPVERMVLEIEELDESASNFEQRKKRKMFYLKNGFEPSGLKAIEKEVTYEVLIKNGSCTAEEFSAVQRDLSGRLVFCLFGPKIVSVTLQNAESH